MSETNGPSRRRNPNEAHPDAPEQSHSDVATELAATKDRLLRCLAEQENIRQQARRQCDETVRYAASGLAGDLLATADNLELAIASVPEERRSDEVVSGLLAGVEATRRALLDAFAKHGLARLDPLGEPFDPERHQAGFTVVDATHVPGTVANVIQPGYLHHDRLLRPALVGVSMTPEESPDPTRDSGPAAG